MDSNQQLHEIYMQGLNAIYTNLITYINKLNLNPQLKAYAFMNLDQGIYWTQLGIKSLQNEEIMAAITPPVNTNIENNVEEIVKEENKEIAA